MPSGIRLVNMSLEVPESPNVWLPGGGEMGERTRAMDWASTSLGPVSQWPRSLRTIVSVILTSRHPMFLWWGPDLIQFYNDAYRSSLGHDRHPAALGARGREFWAEIWEAIGPQIAQVLERGESTWNEDHLVPITRDNRIQEVYWTYSYSPVLDDHARISGVLVTVQETSRRVQSERRMTLLRTLAERTSAEGRNLAEVCRIASEIFSAGDADVAFALLYLFDEDGQTLHLSCTTGELPIAARPAFVQAGTPVPAWPIAEVARSGRMEVVASLMERFGALPGGRWSEPAETAVVLSIVRTGQTHPHGVLVAGVSPRQTLDAAYRDFFDLLSGQLATSLANAHSHEAERQRAEALAELDRAKTVFFSNVSHEFRTPLTLMLGPIEEALAQPEQALAGNDLRTAHRSALRLLKLVNTLLDFTRIEAGRATAMYEETNIALFTADLASTFRSAIEKAGLRLTVDVEAIDTPVFVDRDKWEKIVLNLLSNAFKFTLEGEIAVQLRRSDDSIQLTVRDTGSGIPAGELPRLFERFHRIEGTARRTNEGTGIGLALVQELVKLHGGTVSATSVEHQGTTFTIAIPAGSAHLPSDRVAQTRGTTSSALRPELYIEEALQWLGPEKPGEAAPAEAGLPVPSALGVRPRIVLADDNPDMRQYIHRLLSAAYDVFPASDGAEALEAARAQRPDLVIADVMMPNLDGFKLLRILRGDATTAAIPVLLVSARAGEEARIEGFSAGADDYLVKPFAARELLARVSGLLALARLRRESDDALREIFMKAPAAIAALRGPQHVFQVANPRYLQLVGKPHVIGKPVREALPEIEGQGFFELLDHVYTTGEPFVGRETPVWLERDGVLEEVFLDFVYQPLRQRDGPVNGIFVHVVEVTPQVRSRRELEQVNRELQDADRMKDEFLATLSHELRTPLTSILGWTQMLMASEHPVEQVMTGMETIHRSAHAQSRLIEDVLDVSRITTGKMRLDRRPTDLPSVIEAAIETVQPASDAKEITIRVALDRGLGPQLVDPDRVQQIVWNLLSNAIKFSPPGSTANVVLRRAGSQAVIEVRDEGPGIDPQFLPHLFERFRQADSSSKRAHSGLGLGLALTRNLTELHGGSIEVESEPGRGSTFRILLPIAGGRAPERAPRAGAEHEPTELPLAGVQVLFVDDSADSRMMFQAMLQRSGANVRSAPSVDEALEALQREAAAIVITDVAMPRRDGYDLLREIRATHPGLPVIALTAQARAEDEQKAQSAGFQAYLRKPIDAEQLLREIARHVRADGD